MPNRLSAESSPYLRQHADNPVDWFPWGDESRALAREKQRPILLSIGYSACHWCHVMAHESFEDEQTAAFMNEHFVNVKVDREERPDVDAIYMEAVQSMTGHGGWPLTAFLDPDGVPFYAGTYFPPESRAGMPSFRMVMDGVLEAWQNRRAEIAEAATKTREQLGAMGRIKAPRTALDPEMIGRAATAMAETIDPLNGGFGSAPKFPPASALEFLLDRDITEPVELTLDKMAAGGINDHLAGGFSRYTVDAVWLVPHFEKMLYDNALLARAYLHGWQAMGAERWRRVCENTLDWALNEMRGPEGGFYSALDADSEGEEGRFYVWTPEQIRDALAAADLEEHSDRLIAHYGVSEQGNFEGRNILHLPAGPEADEPGWLPFAREALLKARAKRVRPGLDDKRLTSWNALMISALAEAGAVLDRSDYLDAAVAAAEFIEAQMRGPDGHLQRSYNDGEAKLNAYLEDHSFLLEAHIDLYQATFDPRWYEAACATAETMVARFADTEGGGFFTTAHDHEELIARRKDVDDHPIPSGNAAAALGLFRLTALGGDQRWAEHGDAVLRLLAGSAERHPSALAHLLRAADFRLSGSHELALVVPEGSSVDQAGELLSVARSTHRPRMVIAVGAEGSSEPPLLAERRAIEGKPSAYLCEGFSCQAPVTDPGALADQLEA